jgi:hypothetical protein
MSEVKKIRTLHSGDITALNIVIKLGDLLLELIKRDLLVL